MDRPEDVEFLTGADDTSVYDEDVVEFGRGAAPRWIVVIVVVAVIAAAVTAIAAHARRDHPMAQYATTAPAPGAFVPPRDVFTPFLGSALSIGPTAAVDVAVVGSRLYVLQVGRLAVIDTRTTRILAQATVRAVANGSTLRLVSDPADSRMWVVTTDSTPTLISEFDAHTLTRLRTTSWPKPVQAAVILDGDLYLQGDGVSELGRTDSSPHLIPALAGESGTIAADAIRHRLLILRFGSPTRVLTYSRGGDVHVMPTALDVTKADIAVINGRIWLGGYAPAGAELEQLDSVTFAPGPNNPLFDFLGAGARVVASGEHVLWVRAGSGQMVSALSCVDASSGRELRSWFGVDGHVASAGGRGYLANGSAVLPLELGACRG
jgi:hypothetical protein